ncbi:MAG: hypothetical protein E7231_16220 [Cellulosilyticum sp.]|nr:hypothetical protein [Cellulosilyticum sp.]
MRITQINVQGLYGIHHYQIDFVEEACLKIIHAPNGYGKTTVLKLIKEILNGQLGEIREIPFESFSVTFNEGQLIVAVHKEISKLYYKISENEKQTVYEIQGDQNLPQALLQQLQDIEKEMPIYFIDASRLWIERRKEQTEEVVVMPRVLEYAKELGEWMREALAQSNYCGQALDRSFPSRLITYLNNKENRCLSPAEIHQELEDLEKKRRALEGVGLFSALEPIPIGNIETLSEDMQKVLILYIEDSKKKIEAFEVLATKINLLCSLINKRFSYKRMEVNMKEGFVFRVPTHEVLKADKLSSGEQNELILMFQLLFKAPAHAMILMDEPEISLHIAWQQSFLEDMEAIAKLSQIRMMIATHSPDIINGRWELTTGLEEEECDPI